MFQFPAFAFRLAEYHDFIMMGCPIRISAVQRTFAPPHSFSQLTTSFFASESLGIPRVPLLASYKLCRHNCLSTTTQFIYRLLPAYKPSSYQSSSMSMNSLFEPRFMNQDSRLLVLPLFSIANPRLQNISCLDSWFLTLGSPYVENNGFEPLTPCVQGRCSSQLS